MTFGIALIIYELYPLAPPRMLSTLGFVDTMRLLGPGEYHAASDALLYNPYAAMPSLHFGLAFLMSLILLRNRGVVWKVVALSYLGVMLAAVVITGNHYIVDGLAAVGVVALSYIIYTLIMSIRRGAVGTLLSTVDDLRGGARTP